MFQIWDVVAQFGLLSLRFFDVEPLLGMWCSDLGCVGSLGDVLAQLGILVLM